MWGGRLHVNMNGLELDIRFFVHGLCLGYGIVEQVVRRLFVRQEIVLSGMSMCMGSAKE